MEKFAGQPIDTLADSRRCILSQNIISSSSPSRHPHHYSSQSLSSWWSQWWTKCANKSLTASVLWTPRKQPSREVALWPSLHDSSSCDHHHHCHYGVDILIIGNIFIIHDPSSSSPLSSSPLCNLNLIIINITIIITINLIILSVCKTRNAKTSSSSISSSYHPQNYHPQGTRTSLSSQHRPAFVCQVSKSWKTCWSSKDGIEE